MSTEFNPMEGLLADLLSTWDEDPAAVPDEETSSAIPLAAVEPVETATTGSAAHRLPAPPPPPVMFDEPVMVAEMKGTASPFLPGYLPEPAFRAPARFVSALIKPVAREPIFLDQALEAVPAKAASTELGLRVVSSELVPANAGTNPDTPSPVTSEPITGEPITGEPIAGEPIATAPLPIMIANLVSEDLVPVWREDAGAAAACAAILARMEQEFAQREPVALPARKTRLGSDAPRYVVFVVREMFFAVPIGRVLETDRMTPVTPLPGAAPGVKGLTNLRGEVVPVIDLRELLGWAPPDNPTTRRMLVIQDGNRQPLTALLVDQVKGLAAFSAAAWKPAEMAGAPGMHHAEGSLEGYVEAVTERDGEWVSRLNLDRVLTETHLPSLAAA